MDFEIIGKIRHPETFAKRSGIREMTRLSKFYGDGRWRKCKGLSDGTVLNAEIHWYEATGLGKREFKIKRYLE